MRLVRFVRPIARFVRQIVQFAWLLLPFWLPLLFASRGYQWVNATSNNATSNGVGDERGSKMDTGSARKAHESTLSRWFDALTARIYSRPIGGFETP